MATHEPAKPRPLNPFLLDDLLIQVVTALQQSGLEIHDNANAVATLARLLQAYADQGGTAEELLAIRNDLPELKEVNRVRRQLKLQFDEVRRVRELATALDLYGIPEGEVAAFLGFWKRMKELNFDPAWLSALAEELARQHQANPQAVDALIKLALKGEGFEAQVNETHEHYQRIDNYCRERRSDLQELEEQQRNYARNVAELKKERDELVLEVRVRELQLAELDKLVAGRKGQLALLAGGEGGASK